MAENNFITRYIIYKKKIDSNLKESISNLNNLFSNTMQEVFYGHLMNFKIEEEKIFEVALEEKKNNSKSFFKVTELGKESDDIVYGKAVFSKFDELLDPLMVTGINNKISLKSLKIIPQRTFFFSIKFFKIRDIDKENFLEIGLLLLHKQGTHSIFTPFKEKIKSINENVNIEIEAIAFKDEEEELEKMQVKEIKKYVVRKIMTDSEDDKSIADLGIESIKDIQILKFNKPKISFKKIYDKICGNQIAPFCINNGQETIEVSLKKGKKTRKISYSTEGNQEKITSIAIEKEKVYNEKNEINWDFIKETFFSELEYCSNKLKTENWNEK